MADVLDERIGLTTAYGYAKSKGYTGTEEEFAAAMANAATTLESITEAVDEFLSTTLPNAVQSVTDEGTAQVSNVQSEGATQIGNVNTAGANQVSAIQTKGAETIASIPADYTDLSNDVNDLKTNLNTAEKIIYNHFDGNYEKYVVLSNNVFAQNDSCSTAILECEPNTTYYIKTFGTHNRGTVGCGNKKYPIGETVTVLTSGDWNYGFFVTTPSDATYLYIYVSNANQTPNMYVGTVRIYDYFSNENPIKASQFDNVVGNKIRQHSDELSNRYVANIFDGNYTNDKGLLVYDGVFCFVNVANTISAIAPVEPNTHYYIRSFDNHNRFRLATTDSIPELGMNYSVIANQTISNLPTHYEFVTNSTAKWLILTVSNQSDMPRLQITKGEDYPTFIGYNTLTPRAEKKFYFLDDISGVFDSDAVTTPLDASTTRIGDIYAIYDSLVTNIPNYVSMSVLGAVSTENLEMRKYVFNSLQIQNDSAYTLSKPKLLLIAGIHGYEQGSSYCLARVMKQIAEGTDDASKFIRDNIEIIVVPVANPYGYNHNQRKNENGVDLNRNFAAGWTLTGQPTDEYYGGASANSEAETQILTTLIGDNTDAFYAVDFHNIADGYPLMYLYSNAQVQFCNSLFVTLTKKWNSEYTGFPTDRLLGYCATGVEACFAKQALSEGIDAFVSETPWIMPVIGSTQYDTNTLTIGNDVFGNVLYVIAKALAKGDSKTEL